MPKISIIIPVFNDFSAIQETLKSLKNQTASTELFEIIVVDNGSSDGSVEWLNTQKDITFLQELTFLGSPYSCRNRGIEIAKGEIIVLLDSTCVPSNEFVEQGWKFYEQTNSELFGGNVLFDFENKPTLGKMYDSITNVQMRHSIETKQEAKTANLWVNKSLFSQFGMFIEGVRSGEDVRWTKSCTSQGINISYCETCVVYKYARGLYELMIKQIRVGKGQVGMWKRQNVVRSKFVQAAKKNIFPLRVDTMKAQIARNKSLTYSRPLIIKLYFVAYLVAFANFYGNVIGLLFGKSK